MFSVKQWRQDRSQVLFKMMWGLAFTLFPAVKEWVGFLHWRRPMTKQGSEQYTVARVLKLLLLHTHARFKKGLSPSHWLGLQSHSTRREWQNTSGGRADPGALRKAISGNPAIALQKECTNRSCLEALVPTRSSQTTHLTTKQDGKTSMPCQPVTQQPGKLPGSHVPWVYHSTITAKTQKE